MVCHDSENTCDYDTCLCDKTDVEFGARHRETSFDQDFAHWRGICDEPVDTSDDSDQCPPFWEKNCSYPRESSIFRIKIVFFTSNQIVFVEIHACKVKGSFRFNFNAYDGWKSDFQSQSLVILSLDFHRL